jgi:F-type H+-transporting ATPase subunit b
MISVDASLIVVFILIWILLAVLTKIFFKPVRNVMGKRDSKISDDTTAGKKADEKYEKIIEKIEEDLKAAKNSSVQIKDRFEKEALKEKEKMLSDISSECRDRVREAQKALDKQIYDLKKKIHKESGDLAKKIEDKILE